MRPNIVNYKGTANGRAKKPHSGDNFVGTGVNPCKSAIKRAGRVGGDIFIRVGVSPLADGKSS